MATPARLVVAATVLVLIVCAAVSIVTGSGSRAVVAVSRFGSGVRLLPRGLAFSPLLLARRVSLSREAGGAVLAVPAAVPMAGGASLPVELRLRLEGAGPLPVDAAAVRAKGWEGAWRQRLEGALRFGPDDATAVLAATPLWREIFPVLRRTRRSTSPPNLPECSTNHAS
jgi:hypothetical protein